MLLKWSIKRRNPCRPNLTRFKLWGVVPASEHQEILIALASLIRSQRYKMALIILDNELGGGC